MSTPYQETDDQFTEKTVTDGLDPKVPIQAVTTLLVALLAVVGLDMDEETAGGLALVIGFIAGVLGPAAKTYTKKIRR